MAYGDHCHSNHQRKIQLMRSRSYTIMAKAIFCLTTGLYRVIATHFHQMLRVYNQENGVSSGKMESLSANWALQIPGHPVNLQGHHSMFSMSGQTVTVAIYVTPSGHPLKVHHSVNIRLCSLACSLVSLGGQGTQQLLVQCKCAGPDQT